MERALTVLSVLALTLAGVVFVLCFIQLLQGTPTMEWDLGLPIKDKFKEAGHAQKGNETRISPLVEQAEAFALYLSPPPGPKAGGAPVPTYNQTQNMSAAGLPNTTPKFKLLATSYYRLRPGESMALVSEPGGGVHWVKQGAHFGHFVVESIKRRIIIYRDGDTLGEMAIDTKIPVHTEKVLRMTMASARSSVPPVRPASLRRSNAQGGKLLHKLGLQRPEAQPIAYDRQVKSNGR